MKIATTIGIIAVVGLIGYTTTNAVLHTKSSDTNLAETSSITTKKSPAKKNCVAFADTYNKRAGELNTTITQYKTSGCYARGAVTANCKKLGASATAIRKEVDSLRKTYEECVISNDEQPKYIKK